MDNSRYQRIDHPSVGRIYCVVVPGWLNTPITHLSRSDDQDVITIHIPKMKGLEWTVESTNGRLEIRPTVESSEPDPYEQSLLPIVIRVPLRLMDNQRRFCVERRAK